MIYKWNHSWSIAIVLFWCIKTDGITSVMFSLALLSRNLVPTWLSFWKRILKKSTALYDWRPTLATYFVPLRNIFVGLQTMPREMYLCSFTTCAVTTPQPTSILCLELVADHVRTSVLRVRLLLLWKYHYISSSLIGEWAAEVTVHLKIICISFCDQLKWCHSYVSCLSCTSLSTYLSYGFMKTAVTSEIIFLELQICQRPCNWWTRPLLKLLRA